MWEAGEVSGAREPHRLPALPKAPYFVEGAAPSDLGGDRFRFATCSV